MLGAKIQGLTMDARSTQPLSSARWHIDRLLYFGNSQTMNEGPDISAIAALIGNPACANMLIALMAGPALTSGELARGCGLSPATTSGYLARMEEARLVIGERQGRHRYFRLADAAVARAIEGLLPLAERAGHLRSRPGPQDASLRHARSCYDHLAGRLAVDLYDTFMERNFIEPYGDGVVLTNRGRTFLALAGIDIGALERSRRSLCRPCLDWSERHYHLAGSAGAAIFDLFQARGWAVTQPANRVVRFSKNGEDKIRDWFGNTNRPSMEAAAQSAAGTFARPVGISGI
jgi:DNA-binding transcriptional ArsR family regulator